MMADREEAVFHVRPEDSHSSVLGKVAINCLIEWDNGRRCHKASGENGRFVGYGESKALAALDCFGRWMADA